MRSSRGFVPILALLISAVVLMATRADATVLQSTDQPVRVGSVVSQVAQHRGAVHTKPGLTHTWVTYDKVCHKRYAKQGPDRAQICLFTQSNGPRVRCLKRIVRNNQAPVMKAWCGIWNYEDQVYNLVMSDTVESEDYKLRALSPKWDSGVVTCQSRGWYRVDFHDGSSARGRIRGRLLPKFCGSGGG